MTDTPSVGGARPPRVLLLYYSYTGQAHKVLDAAGEVFRDRGCDVQTAEIKFTDQRYAEKFSRFPMRRVWPDMLSVLGAQKRNETGEIETPDTVRDGDYDLILIGSPTWWDNVSMPLRSFLKSDEAHKLLSGKPFAVFVVCRTFWQANLEGVRELAEAQGGRYVDEIHFTYPGDNLHSMLALTSYLGTRGVPQEISGPQAAADQRAARTTGTNKNFRRPSGGSPVGQGFGAAGPGTRLGPLCPALSTSRSPRPSVSTRCTPPSAPRSTGWPGSGL